MSNRKKPNSVTINILFIKAFAFTLLVITLFLMLSQIYKFDYRHPIKSIEPILSLSDLNHTSEINVDPEELESKIKAKSYLIYDLNSNSVIVGKEENDLQPIASISKLMTAYVALNDCADDVKSGLDQLLIASDNEIAEDIARNCPNRNEFIDRMNYYASKKNLKFSFKNPSGLDDEANNNEVSNWGNAVSVAKLINLLSGINKNLLYHTTLDNYKNIHNTNTIITNIPFIIGSKTGYTDSAGGNLVTLYDIGTDKKVAIIVFGSTKEGRFTDTEALLKLYLNSL